MSWLHLALAALVVASWSVFVTAYRHALAHWLAPTSASLPVATVGGGRGPAVAWTRRFHAAIIALAFVSVGLMVVIAVALVGLAIAS